METKQTDNLLSGSSVYLVDGFKQPAKPRFINRQQNLYSVYQNNSELLDTQQGSESSKRIDLILPGGNSYNIQRSLIKKPLPRTIKALSLRLIATCVYIAFIGACYLLIQNFLNVEHVVKQGNKAFDVIQSTSAKEAASISGAINASILKENAPILILNGTPVQGQAANLADTLKQNGYNVIGVANAPTTDFSQTVLFDLSKGKDAYTENDLEQKFNTTAITLPPGNSIQTNGAAFVIIIGSNETINSQG